MRLKSVSLQLFTEHFTHEFMEELWYLQKVARGDIAGSQRVQCIRNDF